MHKNKKTLIDLQISVQDWDGREYIAYYDSIVVGSEETQYTLTLSGYDDVNSTLADSLTIGEHVNAKFTTNDNDNDAASTNCATDFSGGIFMFKLGQLFQSLIEK